MLRGDLNGKKIGKKKKKSGHMCKSIPGLERSLADRNDNPFGILAWRIPCTEKSGRIQSMGSHRIRHD